MKKFFRLITVVQVVYQGIQMYKEHRRKKLKKKKFQNA